MKKFYILALAILSVFSTEAQQCATHDHTNAERAFFLNTIKNLPVVKNSGTTCIPIKLYVFREDDGSGGVSNEDLNKGLSNLNYKFLDAGIEFYYTAFPVYIDNSDLNNYNQQSPDNDTEADIVTAAGEVTNAVNIYYVDNITTASGFLAAGYAYYPGPNNSSNRIFMTHSTAAGNANSTFTHEFGHYFSLPHTFSGTENGNTHPNAENVPRTGPDANCSTNGDSFCDTDADPEYSGADFDDASCTHLGTDTDINGIQYNPLTAITNIMSYYDDDCVIGFTPEQYTAMAQGLVARQAFTNYDYSAAPMSVTAPSGLTTSFVGVVILNWTDNASNEMGYIIERSETSASSGFKAVLEGGTAADATSYTDFSALANTTYYYRIKASNGDCNTYSNVSSVTTPASIICSASANQGNDEYISNVTLGAINNSTGSNNYTFYSSLNTDLTVGTASAYSVTNPGNPGGGGNGYTQDTCAIWIDWNQDGDFDDVDENVVKTGGMGPYTGTFTPPATALAGATLMRVRIHYNDEVSSPCGTTVWGEVEDYIVNVVAPASFCLDEDFSTFSGAGYQTGSITIGSQTWSGISVLAANAFEAFGGAGTAVRINDNIIGAHLTTPSISAPDTVKFQYRELNSGGGTFKVQKSLNGAPFVDVCTQAFSGTTYTQHTCYIGETNPNVEIRILNDNNNGHLLIDNFQVICGTPVTPPASDPTVELTASANAGTEAGTTSITLTATTSAAVTANETVTLAVTGTNITGTDYTNAASITIMNGATTGTTTFDIVDDTDNEITEMANVHISMLSSGLDSGTIVSQNILITDNDNPTITIPAACSFETGAIGGEYFDVTGFDGNTDHDLINNPTEASVDYLYSGSGEIGFDAFYIDGQGSDGLTDGDFVGVSNYTVDVGAYTDGTNGYQMSDIDGIMQLVFDPVSLSGFASYNLTLDVFINSDGYETTDFLRIYAIVDGGVELDLVNTVGLDIDLLGIEGSWNTLNQSLTGYTTAQLVIEASTNATNEAFYFDNILFTGSNLPMIDISNDNMSGFTYLQGNGPSPAQTNTVSWANLIGNVSSLNVVNYFEISVDGGISYNPASSALNILIPPFPTTFGPGNVEIRLIENLTAGIYLDTIYISTPDGSGGFLGDTVYLAGEVTAPTLPCSQLFISQYGEPSSGNGKYIEIYNPTSATIDLSNYQVWKIANGGNWPENDFTMTGMLASGQTWVVANNTIDVPSADETNTATMNFSGDDAVGIAYNGGSGTVFTLIDAVGTDGPDPGSGWTVAGTGNATQNGSLVRKSTIQNPNDDWTSSAGTDPIDSEWEVVPYTQIGLGSHISDCIAVDYVWEGTTDTDWNTASNWSGNIVPGATDSVTIPDVSAASGNFPMITPAVTLGNVEVEANASLTIVTGIVLNGTFTNNGEVVLQNGAYLDDFTNASSANFIGSIIVETTASNGISNDQRFISSPVNTPSVSEIGDDLNGPWGAGLPGTDGVAVIVDDCALQTLTSNSNYGNLFELNESIMVSCPVDGWVVRSTGSLENARGYSAYLANGSTFDFEGSPNTGTIAINTTNSGNAVVNGEGWNLIGNPYPSPISRDDIINAGATDAQYFVTSGVYQGSFSPYMPGSNIAIGQGFQVHVNTSGLINMDNTFRNTNAANWYQNENWFDYKLEVSVFGNNAADKSILFYNENASNQYEAMYDVVKRTSSLGQPTLATLNQNNELALNGMNKNDLGETVPMTFYPGTSGEFSIDVNGMETFPDNTNIYLKDLMLDVVHNLNDGDYNFTSNVNDDPNRFELIFVPYVEFIVSNIDCEGLGGNISPLNPNEARKYNIFNTEGLVAYGTFNTMNESLTEGDYNIELIDIYGGTQQYDITIEAAEKIEAAFNISATDIFTGEVLYIENTTYNATNFSWSINNTILENIETPSYTFEEEGVYEVTLNVSNETCEDKRTANVTVISKTTGIDDKMENKISLYPNPVKNTLNIISDGNILVKVYSILGELTIKTTNKIINFEQVEKGIYFVEVQDGKGNILSKNKVIKE